MDEGKHNVTVTGTKTIMHRARSSQS